MTAPDLCPLCGADLTGEPIPDRHLHLYGGRTHYTRRVAFYEQDSGRIVRWFCPDCHGTWPVEEQQP